MPSRLRLFALLFAPLVLGGCSTVVLDPSGDVAARQRDLLVESTGLMLLIIIPVMLLTALFAWHYRRSNTKARYEPDWDHSTQLELVIWGGPLLIIICLGALTWMGTHLLDPYRSIGRIASGQPVGSQQHLQVDVVALDWKWLFIYPQYGVATVNELAAPVDTPIDFRITSSSVMNSFYIPALAGQIYAMPGMETKLHAVINKPGVYQGFSANYSGAGFSNMHFAFNGLASADFNKWVGMVKSGTGTLDRSGYIELAKPSEAEPVRRYPAVDDGLYRAVLNRCVEPGKMCASEMSAIDAKGGLGLAGIDNLMPLARDGALSRSAVFGPVPASPISICTVAEAKRVPPPSFSGLAGSFSDARAQPPAVFTPIRAPAGSVTGPLRPSNS